MLERNSSKLSFYLMRPSQKKDQFNIQLPLLATSHPIPLDLDLAHQINSLNLEYKEKDKLGWLEKFLISYKPVANKYLTIIHPQSNLLLFWNIFQFFVIFITFIEIPIALLIVEDQYDIYHSSLIFQVFYYLIMVFLLVDMLAVRPCISYQVNGRYLNTSDSILRYYIETYFIFDLLCLLALIISFLPPRSTDYFRFVFFLKLKTMREINREIKGRLLIKRYASAIYEFMKLVFLIMVVTNFYSCVYFAIDYHYYKQQGQFYQMGFLWLNGSFFLFNMDLVQSFNRVDTYIYSLYWSLQTAGSCGYGIATPKNYVEIFYVNFVILTIVFIFVYFTDGVINLIVAHGEARRKKLNTIKKVVDVCQQLRIKRAMKNKVVEYISDLRNYFGQELQQSMETMLSKALNSRFLFAYRSHFLDVIQMINLIAPNEQESRLLKIEIARLVKSRRYQQNDIIYNLGFLQPEKLLLIERGMCLIQNQQLGYRKMQNQWGLIGKREFYFKKVSIYTVIARQYIEGLELDRIEFMNCLKKHRDFFESYRQIIDGIEIQRKETSLLHLKCPFCNAYHLHDHCNLVNDWRLDLRIRSANQIPSEHLQSRISFKRVYKASAKSKFYKLKSFEVDCIYKSKKYLPYYNL